MKKKNIADQLIAQAVKDSVTPPVFPKNKDDGGALVPDGEDLEPFLRTCLAPQLITDRQLVVVCFGTTAIAGDALGPEVGTLLKQRYNVPAFVYGTQDECVNGKNMQKWIDFVGEVHKDALFVAVDASLGKRDRVGQIVIRSDGVCPAAVKGGKKRFGDVGILAVVAENAGDALMQLMTVSPLYVSELAAKIADMLSTAISYASH